MIIWGIAWTWVQDALGASAADTNPHSASAAKLTHKDVKSGKSETILYKVEMETWMGDTKEKLQSGKLPSEDDNTLILKLAILLGENILRIFISQIWFN